MGDTPHTLILNEQQVAMYLRPTMRGPNGTYYRWINDLTLESSTQPFDGAA